MKIRRTFGWMTVALCVLIATAQSGMSAVSAEDAAKLKATLSPFGAERAGNKDGTIPAWEGGYKTNPPGYKSGAVRPDPFANEKPLFSITDKNVGQYSEKLSEGNKAMFKKYPSYRIDVYPTHRTASAPEWVYENTFQNATLAKTKSGGLSIEGAYGGIPFPIPKDGYEATWNFLTAWWGEKWDIHFRAYTITPAGSRVLATEGDSIVTYPYYRKGASLNKFDGIFRKFLNVQTSPPYKAGESILTIDPVDQYGTGRVAYQYLSGQRRTRRAPSIAYDTPNFVVSGVANFDEVLMFNGALDRYDWKLLGKKEMFIPYNTNGFLKRKIDEVIGKHHLNPDYVRWELHRVWVVEATLRSGKRHVVAKRRFYLDEDTWLAAQADGWDGQGQLWKAYWSLPFIAQEVPCVAAISYGIYNVQTGAWMMDHVLNESPVQFKTDAQHPANFWTPDAMAGMGVR